MTPSCAATTRASVSAHCLPHLSHRCVSSKSLVSFLLVFMKTPWIVLACKASMSCCCWAWEAVLTNLLAPSSCTCSLSRTPLLLVPGWPSLPLLAESAGAYLHSLLVLHNGLMYGVCRTHKVCNCGNYLSPVGL